MPSRAENPDEYALSLGEHLEELRTHLLRIVIAVFGAMLVLFFFFNDFVYWLCEWPVRHESIVLGRVPEVPPFTTLKPLDLFTATIVYCMVWGIVITAPFVGWQIWSFVRSGLFPTERRAIYRYVVPATLLFLMGFAFGYFIMLPIALDFLMTFGLENKSIEPQLLLTSYLYYFFLLTFVMAVIFEIPIVILALARAGIVEPAMLRKYRKHFIVVALVLGMILTPPDPVTQLLLAGPIFVLYEFGILLAGRGTKRRKEEHDEIMSGPNPWDELMGPKDGDATDPDGDDTAPVGPDSDNASTASSPDTAPADDAGSTPVASDPTAKDAAPKPAPSPDAVPVPSGSSADLTAPTPATDRDDASASHDRKSDLAPPTGMFSPTAETESNETTAATDATPAPRVPDAPGESEDADENDAPAAPALARTALTRIPLAARPSNLPPLDVEAERLIARVLARLDETLEPHVRAIIVDAVETQFAEAGEKVFFDQMRWFVDQDLPSLLSAEIDAVLEDRKNRGVDG